MENTGSNYISNAIELFQYYKGLADRAIAQVSDEQLHWQYNTESNSIAVVMKHIAGNSISRWTDFLNSDGEKPWRNREAEFEDTAITKQELFNLWEEGWQCLFNALSPLTHADLQRIIYIRNEGHTVLEAVNRQLTHLPYHVGQIVFIARMLAGDNWQALTIPKGGSTAFNTQKFAEEKSVKFFTSNHK